VHQLAVAAILATTAVATLAVTDVATLAVTDVVVEMACSMAGSVTCCPAFVVWSRSVDAAVVTQAAATDAIQVVQLRLPPPLVAVATS